MLKKGSMEDEYVTLRDRCLTCAYREGTEASKSPNTVLKAALCLETGEPFLCHSDPSRRALCKGWVDAFVVRIRKATIEDDPLKVAAIRAASNALCELEDSVLASQSTEAKRLYDAACVRMERS